jgi:hypothetical protein
MTRSGHMLKVVVLTFSAIVSAKLTQSPAAEVMGGFATRHSVSTSDSPQEI